MKRYRIEVQSNGVAVWDKFNKVYIIDASTIQSDDQFTVCKRMVKQISRQRWNLKYIFNVLNKEKL